MQKGILWGRIGQGNSLLPVILKSLMHFLMLIVLNVDRYWDGEYCR